MVFYLILHNINATVFIHKEYMQKIYCYLNYVILRPLFFGNNCVMLKINITILTIAMKHKESL